MINYTQLENWGVLKLKGADCEDFLQGLLTNDVAALTVKKSLYNLLLTPQGKYSFDLFLTKSGDEWWIEAERSRLEELKKRLSIYKLRSNVTIEMDLGQYIFCVYGANKQMLEAVLERLRKNHSQAYIDPRLPELGLRLIGNEQHLTDLLKAEEIAHTTAEDYQYHRYGLGVPESSAELWIDKSIPLENGMEELNAISWSKGCYMGQELTARTKYRGLVRKRLLPVTMDSSVDKGMPITDGQTEVGQWRGICRNRGLALLRIEALDKPLQCGTIPIVPMYPSWMQLPVLQ